MTLLGLEQQHESSDWLKVTLREFGRLYEERAELTKRRATDAFQRLLLSRVFVSPHWTVVKPFERTFTQDRALLLEGSFAATAKHYPQRMLYVRILRADEESRDMSAVGSAGAAALADIVINVVLHTYDDQSLEMRRSLPGSVAYDDPQHLRMDLNLARQTEQAQRLDVHAALQPTVNPYKVCPLLLLALDEYLEEKRRANAIPKADDTMIRSTFQLSLADECCAELWNNELVGPQGSAGLKLFEGIFRDACHRLFPDYKTLITIPQWQTVLKNDYRRALTDLPSSAERQGDLVVEGSKSQIADLLGRTSTALDSFIASFPTLLHVEQPFQGN